MKSKSNAAMRMTLFALAIGVTATVANAQQGTFDLPVSAHWGTAVLAAGKHTVRVPIPIGQTYVYLESSNGSKTQIAVPTTIERTASENRCYLHLTKVNGEYYVDEYRLGVSGNNFFFPKPKAARDANRSVKAEEATLINVDGNWRAGSR